MHTEHIPVLHTEVLRILAPLPGESVLDCTLGLGGHARSFLAATSPDGQLIGMDADQRNLERARENLQTYGGRVHLHRMNFRDAASLSGLPVNIVFADLGLSSPHVDDPERGFTFRTSAPLDLRYDQSSGQTAGEFLQSASEERVAEVLQEFGELPRSRSLAKTLHLHAPSAGWKTDDVVACVEKIFTYRAPKLLPQVFQALRIAVNDELGALTAFLDALPTLLKPEGRCGIISYHSLEDRLVKRHFRSLSTPILDERTGQIATPAQWALLTPKAVVPGADEVSRNPRSRSAKFRAISFLPQAESLRRPD